MTKSTLPVRRGTKVANRSVFLKIFFIQSKKGNPNATGTCFLRASDVLRSSPVCPDFAPISCNIISPFNIPLALPSWVYKNVNYWVNETNLNVWQVSIYNSVPNKKIPKILPELNGRLLKLIPISDYVSPELSTDFWISGQTD